MAALAFQANTELHPLKAASVAAHCQPFFFFLKILPGFIRFLPQLLTSYATMLQYTQQAEQHEGDQILMSCSTVL